MRTFGNRDTDIVLKVSTLSPAFPARHSFLCIVCTADETNNAQTRTPLSPLPGRRGDAGKMAVVVSAMGGKPKVTDLLLNSVSLAAAGNRDGSEVCTFVYGAR